MIDFLKFYQYGIAFAAVSGVAFAFTHEVTKYAVKRWILKVPYK